MIAIKITLAFEARLFDCCLTRELILAMASRSYRSIEIKF